MIAKKPKLTQEQAEQIFSLFYFWLDGVGRRQLDEARKPIIKELTS